MTSANEMTPEREKEIRIDVVSVDHRDSTWHKYAETDLLKTIDALRDDLDSERNRYLSLSSQKYMLEGTRDRLREDNEVLVRTLTQVAELLLDAMPMKHTNGPVFVKGSEAEKLLGVVDNVHVILSRALGRRNV